VGQQCCCLVREVEGKWCNVCQCLFDAAHLQATRFCHSVPPLLCMLQHPALRHPLKACCLPLADTLFALPMQACDLLFSPYSARLWLSLAPNITLLRANFLKIPRQTQVLSCAPLLRHVEVQVVTCYMSKLDAPKALQELRSLPHSITWRPLTLCLEGPEAHSTVLEFLAAFASTPLAQAASKLTLGRWGVEVPITALRASFQNVLHFELHFCNQITALSLREAVAAWPMLWSIILTVINLQKALELQQLLEAAARTAAELKAGQPFEVVLQVLHGFFTLSEGNAARMDVLVAAIHNAGGGKVECVLGAWIALQAG